MTKFLVDLQPVGRRIEVEPGVTLLEAAQRGGVDLVATCGGTGICGTCKVRLVKGQLTPLSLTEEELLSPGEIDQGIRMATTALLRRSASRSHFSKFHAKACLPSSRCRLMVAKRSLRWILR